MPRSRAIVWITNREASVFRFGEDDVTHGRLRADRPVLALIHRTGAMQTGHLIDDLALLDRVIDALRGISSWRLVGPDGARDYLLGYLERYKTRDGHVARLLTQLTGVAPLDRPTDANLLEQARQQAVAA